MNKPTLLIGLLVIVGMCITPPWDVQDYDRVGRAADQAINITGMPDRATRAEHTSQVVMYRPVWEPADGKDALSIIRTVDKSMPCGCSFRWSSLRSRSAGSLGGIAYIIGPQRENEPPS